MSAYAPEVRTLLLGHVVTCGPARGGGWEARFVSSDSLPDHVCAETYVRRSCAEAIAALAIDCLPLLLAGVIPIVIDTRRGTPWL